VSPTRYGVYPEGTYDIGDLWYQVIANEDRGMSITDCWICGSTTEVRYKNSDAALCCDAGIGCSSCWSGWSVDHRQRDFPYCHLYCSRTTCNTCWQSDWWTHYRIWRYEFMQWMVVGTEWRHGNFAV
jgi:hypothetical protein